MKKRIIGFIAVFVILATLAMVHNGRLFGHDFAALPDDEPSGNDSLINTTALAKDITGYGGPVPLEIHLSGNRIDSITSLPNNETPGFFAKLEKGGLTHAWDGKTLAEADTMYVDAISGATYSSKAYIANVKAGVAYALAQTPPETPAPDFGFSWKLLAVLVVVVAAATLPLFVHNKKYRLVQQLLNVAVLGFWAGTFIDYAMMLNFFENSISLTMASIVAIALLIVGFIYPLCGKASYYCAWVCPFGSAQDLASRIRKKKVALRPRLVKILDNVRQALWVILLILLYTGAATQWIDYEIFTAFVVESASAIVIAVGAAFIVLAIFIPRPFCRFVCPTGSLIKEV